MSQPATGHKSRARTFDGYKTHLNVDPDDELITNVSVTAANTPDRQVIDELLDEPGTDTEPATDEPADDTDTDTGPDGGSAPKDFEVYGDSAYADGATLHEQTQRGHDMHAKVPPVRNAHGYSKDQFSIDLQAGTVACPAHHTVAIRDGLRHRSARSEHYVDPVHCGRPARKPVAGGSSASTPMKPPYNTPKLARKTPSGSRPTAPIAPSWNARSATSPTAPGRRKARCRGHARILTDILTRASAINLARLATLGLSRSRGLGHGLTRPPTASSTSADEQHRTAQHHFWPTNHTGNPIHRALRQRPRSDY